MVCSTDANSSLSGYSGSCKAFFDFQLSTLHFPAAVVVVVVLVAVVLDGSAAWTAEMVNGRDVVGWWEWLMGRKEKEGWWERVDGGRR